MPRSVRKAQEAVVQYRLPKARKGADRGAPDAGESSAAADQHGHARLLGIDAAALTDDLQRGFAFIALEQLMRHTGLSQARLGDLANIPTTTMARRRRAGRFSPEESDRLLRIARVVADAIQLFEGDEAAARRWLDTPAAALTGRAPIDCVTTEHGARLVEDLIGRLEHGVFT
jgi:putative toxin-antitoxin system antitoxin component (TIGR02293 family)